MKVGIKIRDDIILELEWIRYTDPDTLIDIDTRVARLTLQNDEITWMREYGKTIFYTKNIRSYQFTRGLKKKILSKVRRHYRITKEEWQYIMGLVGSFLDNPLAFLVKKCNLIPKVKLIDLHRARLI